MSSWNCSPIRVLSPAASPISPTQFVGAANTRGRRSRRAGASFCRLQRAREALVDVAPVDAPVVVQAVGVSRGWLFTERELRRKVDRRRGQLASRRIERVASAGRVSDESLRGHLGTLTEGRGLRIENADPTAGLTVAYGREHEPRESSS